MKIAIYGGSFNPPHIGHVAAARSVYEQLKPDKFLIIPTNISPHKDMADNSPEPNDRLEMSRIAFGDIPGAERIAPEEMDLLWRRSKVEHQLNQALSRKVGTPGGGNLMIDQREALHTIDVNSASNVETRDGMSLPLSQNLSAVSEIARQIRLRNLSGIVLVDFIDMDTEAERLAVLAAMEDAVRDDRVKTVIHGFTRLGILEMTRKRTSDTLLEMVSAPCKHCGGCGHIPL